jgi:anti-anti-sigma regulatory factor
MRINECMGKLVIDVGQDELHNAVLLEDAFQRIITKVEFTTIIVDLGRVVSASSIALAAIIAMQGIAMVHRRRIAFTGIQPRVRQALGLLGFDHILCMYDSTAKALASPELPRRGAAAGTGHPCQWNGYKA